MAEQTDQAASLMVRLRPHHLLCILTFAGKGYTPAFTENFQRIAGRLASGNEAIEIVDGPDDVCAPLLCTNDCHCHNASVTERDRLAANALERLLTQPVHAGAQISLSEATLDQMRAAFVEGTIRAACNNCPWVNVCNAISQNGFKDTTLLRSASLP